MITMLMICKVLAIGGSKEKVYFSNEQLCFCYSDNWEHNFIITKASQIYVLDFGDAAFLPTSFMSLVLHKPGGFSLSKISSRISFPESLNLNAMRRASYVLKIASNNRIGKQTLEDMFRETDNRIS